jgi:hypothetical protein
LQPEVDQKVLWEQDLKLLQGYDDTASLDARGYLNLGATHERLDNRAAAVAAYGRAASLSSDGELAAWALYKEAVQTEPATIGLAINNPDGLTMDVRVSVLGEAMARYPLMAELPWLVGYYAFWQRRYKDAVRFSRLAAQLGCHQGGLCTMRERRGPVELHAQFEGPFDVLRHAYNRLGMKSAAEEAGAAHAGAAQLREGLQLEPRMGVYHAQYPEVSGHMRGRGEEKRGLGGEGRGTGGREEAEGGEGGKALPRVWLYPA